MQSTGKTSRSAFTLVELLVVIAVIAILVGFVSALLGGMSEKALDTRARDLCSQVAEAWTVVALTQGRLPSAELVSKATDNTDFGDDLAVRMTPAAIVLLNDWYKTSPIPAVDVSKFKVRVNKSAHLSYEEAVEFGCYQNGNGESMQWRMEPDTDQLRWGLFAPWVGRMIREEEEDGDQTDLDEYIWGKTHSDSSEWGHGVVTVAIDTSGDGKITIPAGTIDNAEDIELRTTAAAWVWNEKKTKAVRSW